MLPLLFATWIATWAASPQPVDPTLDRPLLKLEDQTVRERVRVSIGGEQIRLRLTNEYGTTPLVIGAVTAGKQPVTFDGSPSVTIPAGAPMLSDPIALPVAAGSELSISIYFPKRVATPTLHWFANKRAEILPQGVATRSSIALSAVLVPAKPAQKVLVAIGDSIVDGDGSTVDADSNWTGDLIRRTSKIAVINEGIVGDRLLDDCFIPKFGCYSASILARFDRDALSIPGVTHIVLVAGINDLGFPGSVSETASPRSAADLIAAYKQLIARAHARGVRIIGTTITPFEGVDVPGYWTESKEAVRQDVNKWIRTSKAFDAVIDFDAIVRDPDHPTRLAPKFAAKDHLHPNDAGYKAIADAIDLESLK